MFFQVIAEMAGPILSGLLLTAADVPGSNLDYYYFRKTVYITILTRA